MSLKRVSKIYESTVWPCNRYAQVQIDAFDSSFPTLKSTVRVIVTVTRSQSGPSFQPSATYQASISDGFTVGNVILQVSAIDTGRGVSRGIFRSVCSEAVERRG